jgi:hypothetical protein
MKQLIDKYNNKIIMLLASLPRRYKRAPHNGNNQISKNKKMIPKKQKRTLTKKG